MTKNIKLLLLLTVSIVTTACSEKQKAYKCVITNNAMYSMNESGDIKGAKTACSCKQIYNHEKKVFGKVDKEALASDFGCYFK